MAPVQIANTSVSQRVSARMRQLRQARGWTCQELAKQLGEHGLEIASYVVAGVEAGRRKVITIDEALALTKVFETTFEDLIDWHCSVCEGSPPAGFKCQHCGRESGA